MRQRFSRKHRAVGGGPKPSARLVETEMPVAAQTENAKIHRSVPGEPVPNAPALRFRLLPIGKTRKPARRNSPGLDDPLPQVRLTRPGVVRGETAPLVQFQYPQL